MNKRKRDWTARPTTVEEMLDAIQKIHRWETEHGQPIDEFDHPVLSFALFYDIGARILELENRR